MKPTYRQIRDQLTAEQHAEAKIANELTVQWGKAYLDGLNILNENVRQQSDDQRLPRP